MGAIIRIVAGIVTDGKGRTLLVRKRGTTAFMQPGGKVGEGEAPLDALGRECIEELGCAIDLASANHVGRVEAPAANEKDAVVDADLFECRLTGEPSPRAEIAELLWVDPRNVTDVDLAPLTSRFVLPLVASSVVRRGS